MSILREIAALLRGPGRAEPAADDALALAALMVRVARADGRFDEAERRAIEAALEARFGARSGGGAALLARAEAAERAALDHVAFTRALKAAHEPEARAALLEDLWRVVLADGARDDGENALMRQLGALLHVPDREVQLARRRVERE